MRCVRRQASCPKLLCMMAMSSSYTCHEWIRSWGEGSFLMEIA